MLDLYFYNNYVIFFCNITREANIKLILNIFLCFILIFVIANFIIHKIILYLFTIMKSIKYYNFKH